MAAVFAKQILWTVLGGFLSYISFLCGVYNTGCSTCVCRTVPCLVRRNTSHLHTLSHDGKRYSLSRLRTLFPRTARRCEDILTMYPRDPLLKHRDMLRTHNERFMQVTADEQFVEGHVGQLKTQTRLYATLASLPFIKRVCEIGFNGGHSTLIWLLAKPNTEVISFDLAGYAYVKTMAKYVQQLFPNRLKLIPGNSTETLKIVSDLIGGQCDLVVVDGGHTYAVAKRDLENMARLANPDGHILVFDDHPSQLAPFAKGLERAWNETIRAKLVTEIYACLDGNPKTSTRGFTIGQYLRPSHP